MRLLDNLVKASQPTREHGYGILLPILLGLLTLVIWFVFQTSQLIKERDNLNTLSANQQAIHDNAQKLRTQLDALAAGTARLAQAGNPNAQQVVNALRAQGITINPNAAPTR